ncbi:hypothetical protein DSECCO2_425100 [anaerobic digester metagenome]
MARIIQFPVPSATQPMQDSPQTESLVAATVARKRRELREESKARRGYMLAKVHIAKAQLGLTDEEYRAVLHGQYGKNSAKDLSVVQLHGLLIYFQKLGWQGRRGSAKRGARRDPGVAALLAGDVANLGREALMEKIEALLAEKGRVEGTHMPWNYAMGILKQQTKGAIRDFRQASPDQLRDVMLALLRDAQRKGRRTR